LRYSTIAMLHLLAPPPPPPPPQPPPSLLLLRHTCYPHMFHLHHAASLSETGKTFLPTETPTLVHSTPNPRQNRWALPGPRPSPPPSRHRHRHYHKPTCPF